MCADYVSPYRDDSQISDNALIYRRVHPTHWSWNDNLAHPVVSKGAFQDYTLAAANALGYPAPCMSVYLADVVEAAGKEPRDLLAGYNSEYGLVSLTARDLRDADQGIMPSPEAEDESHAIVFGVRQEKRTQGQRRRLAAAAKWVIEPSASG